MVTSMQRSTQGLVSVLLLVACLQLSFASRPECDGPHCYRHRLQVSNARKEGRSTAIKGVDSSSATASSSSTDKGAHASSFILTGDGAHSLRHHAGADNAEGVSALKGGVFVANAKDKVTPASILDTETNTNATGVTQEAASKTMDAHPKDKVAPASILDTETNTSATGVTQESASKTMEAHPKDLVAPASILDTKADAKIAIMSKSNSTNPGASEMPESKTLEATMKEPTSNFSMDMNSAASHSSLVQPGFSAVNQSGAWKTTPEVESTSKDKLEQLGKPMVATGPEASNAFGASLKAAVSLLEKASSEKQANLKAGEWNHVVKDTIKKSVELTPEEIKDKLDKIMNHPEIGEEDKEKVQSMIGKEGSLTEDEITEYKRLVAAYPEVETREHEHQDVHAGTTLTKISDPGEQVAGPNGGDMKTKEGWIAYYDGDRELTDKDETFFQDTPFEITLERAYNGELSENELKIAKKYKGFDPNKVPAHPVKLSTHESFQKEEAAKEHARIKVLEEGHKVLDGMKHHLKEFQDQTAKLLTEKGNSFKVKIDETKQPVTQAEASAKAMTEQANAYRTAENEVNTQVKDAVITIENTAKQLEVEMKAKHELVTSKVKDGVEDVIQKAWQIREDHYGLKRPEVAALTAEENRELETLENVQNNGVLTPEQTAELKSLEEKKKQIDDQIQNHLAATTQTDEERLTKLRKQFDGTPEKIQEVDDLLEKIKDTNLPEDEKTAIATQIADLEKAVPGNVEDQTDLQGDTIQAISEDNKHRTMTQVKSHNADLVDRQETQDKLNALAKGLSGTEEQAEVQRLLEELKQGVSEDRKTGFKADIAKLEEALERQKADAQHQTSQDEFNEAETKIVGPNGKSKTLSEWADSFAGKDNWSKHDIKFIKEDLKARIEKKEEQSEHENAVLKKLEKIQARIEQLKEQLKEPDLLEDKRAQIQEELEKLEQ